MGIPLYEYFHPETGEIFEVLRPIKDRKKKHEAPDGVMCDPVEVPGSMGYCGASENSREGFQMDPELYKKRNPKFVRYRDGHRERYDPTKHY